MIKKILTIIVELWEECCTDYWGDTNFLGFCLSLCTIILTIGIVCVALTFMEQRYIPEVKKYCDTVCIHTDTCNYLQEEGSLIETVLEKEMKNEV